jgi:hypothetical protein
MNQLAEETMNDVALLRPVLVDRGKKIDEIPLFLFDI